jgi:hypothetical protein
VPFLQPMVASFALVCAAVRLGQKRAKVVLFGATGMIGQGVRRESAYSITMWHRRADLLPEKHGNPSPQARSQAGASSVQLDLDGKWNGLPDVASGAPS